MNIFEFDDYRDFLKKYVYSLPQHGRGELGRIAKFLRINSTLISQILSGQKDFTLDQTKSLCTYLALQPLATDYFILLVQRDRAGSNDLKKYFQLKINDMRESSLKISKQIKYEKVLSESERSQFYSNWVHSAARLYGSVGNGKTIDEITQKFSISRSKAAEIIAFLTSTGLMVEKDGRFHMGTQSTHIEHGSPQALQHHTNWRLKALDSYHELTPQEMMFTGPMSVSKKDLAVIRQKLLDSIRESMDIVKSSEADDVACLNIDLFWVK